MAIATTSQMTQLNMRVDAQDKRQAEEVLRLMGTTTTELVRKLLAKVARGAKDYAEVADAIDTPPEHEPAQVNPVVLQCWAIVDDFCRSLGYERAEDMPKDTRSWAKRYEEAMSAHYEEKGWLQ